MNGKTSFELLTEDAKRLLREAPGMERLLANSDYENLLKIVRGQVENWRDVLEKSDDAQRDSFIKGVLFGLRLFIQTPQHMIEQAKEIRTRMEPTNERHRQFRTGQSDRSDEQPSVIGTVTLDDNNDLNSDS